MKIAYISDLHLNYRRKDASGVPPDRTSIYGEISFPKVIDADCIVLAGDIHTSEKERKKLVDFLQQEYDIPVILVMGNHDYEKEKFPEPLDDVFCTTINGVKIVGATLWSKLEPDAVFFARGFHDFVAIRDISIGKWQNVHEQHVRFIQECKPDVVITHHAPCSKSIAERFLGDPYNQFFVTDLSNFILDQENIKLWIHGHVHNHFDYMIGDCRVVCNPYGYPNELKYPVDIKIIEV